MTTITTIPNGMKVKFLRNFEGRLKGNGTKTRYMCIVFQTVFCFLNKFHDCKHPKSGCLLFLNLIFCDKLLYASQLLYIVNFIYFFVFLGDT